MEDSTWSMSTSKGRAKKEEYIALLQAQSADLITKEQVRARLRVLYPEWFEGDE